MKTLINEGTFVDSNLMFNLPLKFKSFSNNEFQIGIEKEVSEETWFIVQDFIKKDLYIQTQINYAKRRSTGLEQYDYETHVLVMCMDFIKKCFNNNHQCLNSENCVNCQTFLRKVQSCINGYLDKETRNSPISYAYKPFEQYKNTQFASVNPDTDEIRFNNEHDTIEREEGEDKINSIEDLINKFKHILSEKEMLILRLYINGYKPKVIAQLCNFYRVQSVYMSIKRITNKIKMHLNEELIG